MKRTKEWWAALTVEERQELVNIERALVRFSSPKCTTCLFRHLSRKRYEELISKADHFELREAELSGSSARNAVASEQEKHDVASL